VSVVNRGALAADVAGTTITALGQAFTNEGTAEAKGGALNLADLAVNTGTLAARSGSTLSLGGAWDNNGALISDAGTVNLGGSFTLAALGTFQRSGGTVNLTGTLDNRATTLDLAALGGPWRLAGGVVRGGAVAGPGLLATSGGGTLDGVTLRSDLDL